MAMDKAVLGALIQSNMATISPSPENTYQQRLLEAFADAIISHIQTHAVVETQETYVAGAGDNGGSMAAPLGIVAGTMKPKGTVS